MSRDTGPDRATVTLVVNRYAGCCLRCGKHGSQVHHRKPRGAGGTRDPKINSPENLVWLCLSCHEHIERHRKDAYRDGFLVARNADPAERYLITPDHRMIVLLPDGGMEVNELPDNYEECPF